MSKSVTQEQDELLERKLRATKLARERKAAERERKRSQGLVSYTVWIPNTDDAKLRTSRYAEKLVKSHKSEV